MKNTGNFFLIFSKKGETMLLSLFLTFLKIGLFTFGGGYAMIAQIKETVVQHKKWMTDQELLEVIAIAESTPGPIAINLATYVGYKKRGVLGSALATIGVVIPSLIIIFIISLFLDEFMTNKYVAYAFTGIKCAVAFLILKAGAEMFKQMKKNAVSILIFSAVFIAMILFDVFSVSFSSVIFILIGGVIGIILCGISKTESKNNKEDKN